MAYAPTFVGFIPETQDALLLLQAVIEGRLEAVTTRPPDSERENMIRSGAVYIFKEGTIKRWTDKVCWSPSRVLGNFLIYRELQSKQARAGITKNGGRNGHDESRREGPSYHRDERGRNVEFSLYGSLVDSYDFREDGLIKKTISTTFGGDTYRLISYYKVKDVQERRLLSPMEYPTLVNIEVDSQLATGIQFQMPMHSVPQIDFRPEMNIPMPLMNVQVKEDARLLPPTMDPGPMPTFTSEPNLIEQIIEHPQGVMENATDLHDLTYDTHEEALFYDSGETEGQLLQPHYDYNNSLSIPMQAMPPVMTYGPIPTVQYPLNNQHRRQHRSMPYRHRMSHQHSHSPYRDVPQHHHQRRLQPQHYEPQQLSTNQHQHDFQNLEPSQELKQDQEESPSPPPTPQFPLI